jgi:2-amino-4-hydroxy-6-hydroxymethyldihydropteridine diphosphokinase
MEQVVVSLGSNLGEPVINLERACVHLGTFLENLKISSIYKTKPMYFENQPEFYNMVISGYTPEEPEEFLNILKDLEVKMGRQETFRNGPRLIDMDIVSFGSRIVNLGGLEIPHPRLYERLFVLEPLMEVCPNWVCPISGRDVEGILRDLWAVNQGSTRLYKVA